MLYPTEHCTWNRARNYITYLFLADRGVQPYPSNNILELKHNILTKSEAISFEDIMFVTQSLNHLLSVFELIFAGIVESHPVTLLIWRIIDLLRSM